MTTENIIEIVSKVTEVAPGLFAELSSKKIGALHVCTLWCDVESLEYTVLVNKGKIIEIKNDYVSYGVAIIENKLNPPPTQGPAQSTQVSPLNGIQQQQFQAQQPKFNNLPIPITVPVPSILGQLQQYVSDFVKLNPGCVYSLFDPSDNITIAEESLLHVPTVWDIYYYEFIVGDTTHISLNCKTCTNSSIADHVIAYLAFDSNTGSVVSIAIEG